MNSLSSSSENDVDVSLSPFLKWAGGKRWFSTRYLNLVPKEFDRYVEPFLGSGAVYFALRPENALLSDVNADLINCYDAIRKYPAAVEALLKQHHQRHSKEHYYKTRGKKPKNKIHKAAWFIYLNRTE